MTTAKRIFEGLGPGTLIPQRGKQPFEELRLGPDEGFVLSRVDGRTSLEEICLLVPFEEQVTMVILRRLWETGAIEVPGVARTLVQPPPAPAPQVAHAGKTAAPVPPPPAPPETSKDGSAIPAAQKQRIDEVFAALDRKNAFELLELERGADDRAVKRAYFKLSKEFHPDRYFGRDIGEYKERLGKIFLAVKAAFEVLSDKARRAAYEASVGPK
jgi:hypothetical protein